MEEQFRLTAARKVDRDSIVATRLCTHKDDVDNINTRQLEELDSGMQRSFHLCYFFLVFYHGVYDSRRFQT